MNETGVLMVTKHSMIEYLTKALLGCWRNMGITCLELLWTNLFFQVPNVSFLKRSFHLFRTVVLHRVHFSIFKKGDKFSPLIH